MIQFYEATRNDDIDAVIGLVTRVYAEQGYVGKLKGNTLEIAAFLRMESTCTFLAKVEDTLIGTISIVSDSPSGFPMDSIYKNEIALLDVERGKIAEVCQFAIDKKTLASLLKENTARYSELDVSTGLLGRVVQYGLSQDFEFLCFTINPKHRVFYESLGAVQFGEERVYPSVNSAPALAYKLPIQKPGTHVEIKEKKNFLIEKIFATPIPEVLLT